MDARGWRLPFIAASALGYPFHLLRTVSIAAIK
jgi:hypothetical protein